MYYKFTNDKEMEFHLPEYNGNSRYIVNKQTHKTLAKIDYNGILTVYEGYSWDGCSPKWELFETGIILGTWDGFVVDGEQQLKYPSMVHDVLCQMFHGHDDIKFYTRKDIDVIFRNMMKSYGVPYWQRVMYYYAVRGYALVNGYV